MSKRCFSLCAAAVAIAAVMVAVSPLVANAQARATIIIDSLASTPIPGDTVTLAVRIDNIAPGTSINALDLLIDYDYTFLRLIDLQPGALLTSCGWEYFDHGTYPPNFCRLDSCPDGKLRLVALADLASQPGSPGCFIDQPGEIALMTFTLSHREPPGCSFYLPVRFAWDDCSDNMVTLSTTVDTALISDRVYLLSYDYTGNDPLPNITGAPNECVISTGTTGLTVRGIDYVGGGVIMGCGPQLASGIEIGVQEPGGHWIGEAVEVYIDVLRIAPGYQLGSFEFYIKYDHTKMTFLGGEQGELISGCNYASFDAIDGASTGCGLGNCPDGIVRVIAFASGLQTSPTCYIDHPGQLVKLRFQLANDSSLICSSLPIDLIWFKCGDNSFTEAPDEITAAYPRTVLDVFGFPLPDTGLTFPSTAGDADTCSESPNPKVDLYQGTILIPCAPTLRERGDINLNGISYEIADYIMFTNYLVDGASVLSLHGSEQALHSDVNADGVVLSLNDLIYIHRVVRGDAPPIPSPPKANGDTAFLVQDIVQKTVAVQYVDSLTALYLIFEGEISSAVTTLPNYLLGYDFDGTHTRLLLAANLLPGSEPMPSFGSGTLFTYTGDAILIGAEASYDGLTTIYTEIDIPDLQQCCITRGNVDHDVNQNIDIADATALVQYMFANGPAPICLEEANVNGSANGNIDVSDLVYLIRFMFLNGAAPPACPTRTKAWRYIAQVPGSVWIEGLFTMTVDDPPFYAGEWFLNRLNPTTLTGPQVGQGAWRGSGVSGPDDISMNMILATDQVNLSISDRLETLWLGTWEYSQSGNPISSGQVILFGL